MSRKSHQHYERFKAKEKNLRYSKGKKMRQKRRERDCERDRKHAAVSGETVRQREQSIQQGPEKKTAIDARVQESIKERFS